MAYSNKLEGLDKEDREIQRKKLRKKYLALLFTMRPRDP